MKWTPKPSKPFPKEYKSTEKRFAFLPTLIDGKYVWLEVYYQDVKYVLWPFSFPRRPYLVRFVDDTYQ